MFGKIDYKKIIKWPEIEQKYLQKETNNIVIQVNGKKTMISIEKDTQEDEIIKQVKNKKLIDKYLII